jgi:DNA-binding MarR family transcriptional regulator
MGQARRDAALTPLEARPTFLLSQLGRFSAERFAECLRPLGLQPRHFGLLVQLAKTEGQSQQRLAASLGIHRNVMVGLLDELEARGLVERRRHPGDRRANALYLSATARALLTKAERLASQHDAQLVAALDEDEQRLLIALLQRIAHQAGLQAGVHPGLQGAHGVEPCAS